MTFRILFFLETQVGSHLAQGGPSGIRRGRRREQALSSTSPLRVTETKGGRLCAQYYFRKEPELNSGCFREVLLGV